MINMMQIEDLEHKLKIVYPKNTTYDTNYKRKRNINYFMKFIKKEIEENNLIYQKKEERLLLYTTNKGEKIYIQFPGKESSRKEKMYPFDFRPKIIDNEGKELPDMKFEDMWSVLDNINSDYKKIMKCVSLIFFRMGRMTNHVLINKEIQKNIIENNLLLKDININFELFYLDFDKEDIDFLNTRIETIKMFDSYNISFEAFLYFFELILQNEDNKYYYKKNNLDSGRIKTSDSMLLLSSYYSGKIKLPTLLHKFVVGMGIGTITKDEIAEATDDLISFCDKKKVVKEELKLKGIDFKENTTKTLNKKTLNFIIKIETRKIGFIGNRCDEKKQIYDEFEQHGWKIIDINTMELSELNKIFKDYDIRYEHNDD